MNLRKSYVSLFGLERKFPQLCFPLNYTFSPITRYYSWPFFKSISYSPCPKSPTDFYLFIYSFMCRIQCPWDCKPAQGNELRYSKWLHRFISHSRKDQWDLNKNKIQPYNFKVLICLHVDPVFAWLRVKTIEITSRKLDYSNRFPICGSYLLLSIH